MQTQAMLNKKVERMYMNYLDAHRNSSALFRSREKRRAGLLYGTQRGRAEPHRSEWDEALPQLHL